MDDLGKCILNLGIGNFEYGFTWGLEVERHRMSANGYLSTEPYPELLGQQNANPYIKNDYFNTQSEVITPVANSIGNAMNYLAALDHTLRAGLATNEYLWPFSLPPKLTVARSELAYADVDPQKLAYYQELARRYGLTEGLPAGIHVNLAPKRIWTQMIAQKLRQDPQKARDELLLKQAIGFMHYRWLFTYLNGASPIAEANYLADLPPQPVRSLRNSRQFGYGFASHFKGDYTSVTAYSEQMRAAIAADDLIAETAFHEAVRLRHPAGLMAMQQHGVSHIELRMLDLDPTTAIGIRGSTLLLVQLLALHFMLMPKLDATVLVTASAINDQVALEQPQQLTSQQQVGLKLFEQLQKLVVVADLPPIYAAVVTQAAEKMVHPQLTAAGQLLPRIHCQSLARYGLQQARNFQLQSHLNPSPIYHGFQSNPHPSRAVLQRDLFDRFRHLPRLKRSETEASSYF
ncbi:glutathione synthase [Loigolactobacillus binensis]|uniref:Glutamate--cysteine ligase n=1 Tax=Loigolactobacillus binensis TaxID=2559922 RepID=A0ABW3EEH4_9LACO|nr:glutathione synthase [Loigolactobacillus binensis]